MHVYMCMLLTSASKKEGHCKESLLSRTRVSISDKAARLAPLKQFVNDLNRIAIVGPLGSGLFEKEGHTAI
jgi:hypothetical protein